MKRPQAMKRPKNESRGPGPAGGSGVGWAPKTDASSQPERVDKRPPSERPMWLFLSEPGLGDLALKELKARKVVPRNARPTRLSLRNQDAMLLPDSVVTGAPTGLRLTLSALNVPVFGRTGITPGQLERLAAAFAREKADGLTSTVIGTGFARQDLVRWVGKQLAERGVTLLPEPERPCWLIVVDTAFYFGFTRFNHHDLTGRDDSPVRTGALPQTIAAAAVFAANPGPAEVIWDPVCGSGSLLVEAAAASPGSTILGSDVDTEALAIAGQRLGPLAALSQADAAAADPGRADITLTLANLPWGRQYESEGGNRAFYEAVLRNSLAHAAPDWRGVFVTSDDAALRKAALAVGKLSVEGMARPKVRGVEAGIWRVTRAT